MLKTHGIRGHGAPSGWRLSPGWPLLGCDVRMARGDWMKEAEKGASATTLWQDFTLFVSSRDKERSFGMLREA